MELTNPEGGVQQESSPESRIAALLTQEQVAPEEEQESAAVEQEQPSDQVASDDLTPDDIPTEEVPAQSVAVDEFEIVHGGQQHKLNRADTIKFAQQGFDYTKKVQALSVEKQVVQQNLQRSQEIVNLAPMVAQDLATVKALESQLAQYQQVDWVKLASNDPLEYPRVRAQYDSLVNAYQGAVGQFQRNAGAMQQQRSVVTQQTMAQEHARLPELIPEWRDSARREKEQPEIAQYLLSRGVPQQAVEMLGSSPGDSLLVALARDAWAYHRLKSDKANKVGQARKAPPIPKPGMPAPAQADKAREIRDRLKKSGDRYDAARLIATQLK